MKIVNVSLTAPYNDKWGYQENLLTKWQKKNGNEVTLITTRFISNKNDDGFGITDAESFINDDGVKIIRMDWIHNDWACRTLRIFKNTYRTIEDEKPDFLFIHGCQFFDAVAVCRFLKKHPETKAVVDNHADETNSAKTFFPKILHLFLWRIMANLLNRYIYCFYGVLPIRCRFLTKYYGISTDRIKLLVMGADDDLIDLANRQTEEISRKYSIDKNQFNIVCGGKFDHYKTEILELMKAVNRTDNVHLYIYGSIGDEIIDQFNSLLSDKITFAGWMSQQDSYSLLCISDIAIFPGRHSVIWEQCVGLGVPLVVKELPDTKHIDIGGNCMFIDHPDQYKLLEVIKDLQDHPKKLADMKKAAQSQKKNEFRYSEIAKKSIES